jgi:hypothetical protein
MRISIGNIFKGDKVIWMIFFFLCIISICSFGDDEACPVI